MEAHAGCAAHDWSDSPPEWAGANAAGVTANVAAAFAHHKHSTSHHSIVGLWKFTFTAKGNADIPDGTVVDMTSLLAEITGTIAATRIAVE